MDLFLENSIPCLYLCETWLSVDEEKNKDPLNRTLQDGYSCLHVPRPARGGEFDFIFNDQYKVKLDNSIIFPPLLSACQYWYSYILHPISPFSINYEQNSESILHKDFGELF